MQTTVMNQPTNGYYTTKQATRILGKSRISFHKLAVDLEIPCIVNIADRRAKLYDAKRIDELAQRAVKTPNQK